MPRTRPTAHAAVAVLLLVACSATDGRSSGDTHQDVIRDRTFYVCPDDVVFSVDFYDDGARVGLRDRIVRLARDPADPDRFGDGVTTLRIDGGSAYLAENGEGDRCCAEGTGEVWRDAIRRGVIFRALGQEPGWLVEIHGDGVLVILLDYGTERIETSVDQPHRTERRVEYRVRTADRDVRILIEDRPCRDDMSGEPFPATVALVVDGRSHSGCGIQLAS